LYGADIEQLRALANLFENRSSTLSAAAETIGGTIDGVAWLGPSGEMFREEWAGVHAPGLRDAANSLLAGADALQRNADEQDDTSSVGDAIIGGPFPGSPFPGGNGSSSGTVDNTGDDWLSRLLDATGRSNSFFSALEGAAEAIYRLGNGLKLADDLPFFTGASRALGGLGVFFGAREAWQGFNEGDWWKVADGAIGMGFGVTAFLALSGPVGWTVLGLGAAWALADAIWPDVNLAEAAWNGISNAGEWLWDAGGTAVDALGDAAGWVADGVSDLAGDIWDAGGDLLDGVADVAGSLWPF
jgi:hypothetical protein